MRIIHYNLYFMSSIFSKFSLAKARHAWVVINPDNFIFRFSEKTTTRSKSFFENLFIPQTNLNIYCVHSISRDRLRKALSSSLPPCVQTKCSKFIKTQIWSTVFVERWYLKCKSRVSEM